MDAKKVYLGRVTLDYRISLKKKKKEEEEEKEERKGKSSIEALMGALAGHLFRFVSFTLLLLCAL